MNTEFRKPCPAAAWITSTPARRSMRSSPAPTTPCRTPPACWRKTWCVAATRPRSTESLKQLIERKRDLDFPWFPARVVCHDILGQTALVDLAGLRDAIAVQGGDPAQVNPVVPMQLIVDHSLAVEARRLRSARRSRRTAPSKTVATKTVSTSSTGPKRPSRTST